MVRSSVNALLSTSVNAVCGPHSIFECCVHPPSNSRNAHILCALEPEPGCCPHVTWRRVADMPCAAGQRDDLVLLQCVDCEFGSYQPVADVYFCWPCPNGQTTPTRGSTSGADCAGEARGEGQGREGCVCGGRGRGEGCACGGREGRGLYVQG